jgi:hypothetical protein
MAEVWSRRGLVWGSDGHRISIRSEAEGSCDLNKESANIDVVLRSKGDACVTRKERRATVKTGLSECM